MSEYAKIGWCTWLLMMASVAVGIWLDSASCHSKWAKAGYEVSYGLLQGCMVRVGGKWIPVETIRDVEATK